MKSSFSVPIAIVLGGVIVAIAVYVSMPKVAPAGAGNPSLVRPVSASDHILGNPAARVMIVEYADFDCEFCASFNETLQQVIANEGASGDVALVFREFPLTDAHSNALKHARAAECAAQVGGNDAFWKFADALFANQPIDPSRYGALAKDVGIAGDAFATCVAAASSALDARITADRQNALDMKAQDAPFSLILTTGKPPVVLEGDYPYDVVKQLVDAALAQ